MAEMPVSIPLRLRVKGLKKLGRRVDEVTDLLIALTNRMETLMTSADQGIAAISASLDAIKGDITTIKDTDAATIQALRDELAAAVSGADAATQAAVAAAVDTTEASFADRLKPLEDKAAALDAENPAAAPAEEPPAEPPVQV